MKRVGLDFKDLSELCIIPIADVHLGDPLSDRNKLDNTLYYALQNNAYIVLLGDIMTADIKNSVSNVYRAKLNPQEELEQAIQIFKPVADRILGIVQGNHERRIERETGIDVSKIFALEIGLQERYAPESILLDIKIGKNPHGKPYIYTVICTHGWGGGRKLGSKFNNTREAKNILYDADVYITGHHHCALFGAEGLRYYDKRTDKHYTLTQFLIGANGFLRYGDYSEQMSLTQQVIGITAIYLSGREKRKVYQFISLEQDIF